MTGGIVTLDLHGRNRYQAGIAIESALKRSGGAYEIVLIHGENLGTSLKDMIAERYSGDPRIIRLSPEGGKTRLILREL